MALAACVGKSPSEAARASAATTTQNQVMEPQEPSRKEAVSSAGQIGTPERLAPGSCRLQGKIITVLNNLDPDKNTPCGQVPCRAVVKVQQILGYGSAFGKPLAKNQEINVYFGFTLSPTSRYFPELSAPLPGLKAGDIFVADVTRASDGASAKNAWFQVYSYAVEK